MAEIRCSGCSEDHQQGRLCACSREATRAVYAQLWTSCKPLIVLFVIWFLVQLIAEVCS